MDLAVKKVHSFRISVELLERLKKLAKRENRTLNNYVETALCDLVEEEEFESDFSNEFTPELKKKLAEAEQRRKEGKSIALKSSEDIDTYFASL